MDIILLPDSDTKWHMTIHEKPGAGNHFVQFMKGAPERVLLVCDSILIENVAVPLTEAYKKQFTTAYETMAGKGHRVLAFAQHLLPLDAFPQGYHFDKEKKNFPTVLLHLFLLFFCFSCPTFSCTTRVDGALLCGLNIARGSAQAWRERGHWPLQRGRHQGDDGDGGPSLDSRGHWQEDQLDGQ